MFERFILYIEQDPWEEKIKRQWKWLDRVSWLAILMAVLYFGPAVINIFMQ